MADGVRVRRELYVEWDAKLYLMFTTKGMGNEILDLPGLAYLKEL